MPIIKKEIICIFRCILIICCLSVFAEYTLSAQTITKTLDSADSYMAIKLGQSRTMIPDSLLQLNEHQFFLIKDTLKPFFRNPVHNCVLTFDNKNNLKEITLLYDNFAFTEEQDSIKKYFFMIYNPIAKKIGKHDEEKKESGHLTYTWKGNLIRLIYELKNEVDYGAALISGMVSPTMIDVHSVYTRSITLSWLKNK